MPAVAAATLFRADALAEVKRRSLPLCLVRPSWREDDKMATRSFDVVVIGGGNAGMGVTVPTRKAGLSVAVLEPGTFGGTCSNRGCTPKKVLVAAAHVLDEISHAGAHHIKVGRPRLDWAAMIRRKADLIRPLPERLAGAVRDRG